jgi:hypothetical protein
MEFRDVKRETADVKQNLVFNLLNWLKTTSYLLV